MTGLYVAMIRPFHFGLSLDPPLLLICISKAAHSCDTFANCAHFTVNILADDQANISNQFAWVKTDNKFELGDWSTAVTGAPVLKEALAWLDCTIYSRHHAGTHTIYIGEVQASSCPNPDEKPLIYWNRDYQSLK